MDEENYNFRMACQFENIINYPLFNYSLKNKVLFMLYLFIRHFIH